MKKIYILTLLFLSFVINAQLNEVKELRLIEKKYDSILVEYQKKAKDSLSLLKKKERNEIMEKEESDILKRMKKEENLQLDKIKQKELELVKLNIPDESVKCNSRTEFQIPNLLKKNTKYKPTLSNSRKENQGSDESLSSTVTFIVTGKGYIQNVKAEGKDKEFNKELEKTLYKIGTMTPSCLNGIAEKQRYRLPVTMNFNK